MPKNTTYATNLHNLLRSKGISSLSAVGLAVAVLVGHGAANSTDAQAQTCPASLDISSAMTAPCGAAGVDVIGLQQAAIYMWNTFIAINWPGHASERGKPDTSKTFGATDAHGDLLPVAWTTMRNKVELYPGNGSATVPPHGVTLGSNNLPNNGPDYGYGNAPKYIYDARETGNGDGSISACLGQPPVANPAYVNLDETTQIGNNQLYAGIVPATDPTGRNSKPQLIRYTVKMNDGFWRKTIPNGFWYGADDSSSLLGMAKANYAAAYTKRLAQLADPKAYPNDIVPDKPYVAFTDQTQNPDSTDNAIEIKAAWRPLTAAEAASKKFLTSHVRYYEKNTLGKPCYREDVWGMISMHVISFTPGAPWGVWSTWEHADALQTKDGKPVETASGALTGNLPSNATPVEPMLTSDPNAAKAIVTFKDQSEDYCTDPGSRMFFRENPHLKIQVTFKNKVFTIPTLPSGGKICVNARWRAIPDPIVKLNETAHSLIKAELKKNGVTGESPWLNYRLTNVQSQPVDYDIRDQASQNGAIVNGAYGPYVTSSEESYFMADAVIETDYSLGNFTGDLVEGVPVNKVVEGDQLVDYYNNILLKYQSNGFGSLSDKMRMGGCLGCHGFASKIGQNFSFALGSNPKAPDPVDAFAGNSIGLIDYFTEPRARFMQSR